MGFITKSLHEHLNKQENEITNFTDNGKCSRCASCCTNRLPMTYKEVKKIKEFIKVNNIKPVVKSNFALREELIDGTCPFSDDKAGKCLIYRVRPDVCRFFMCDKTTPDLIAYAKNILKAVETFDVRETFYSKGGK